MLQFTKKTGQVLTTTNGFSIADDTVITGFVNLEKSTTTYWYYRVDWFIGVYSDYPPNTDFLKFKELPFDFKVDLFNDEGNPIYNIPSGIYTNYTKVIDMVTYPLQQYIINDPDNLIEIDLTGELNIVFS